MKQQTMVAMMTTKRRMEEAMPAKVVGLQKQKGTDKTLRWSERKQEFVEEQSAVTTSWTVQ